MVYIIYISLVVRMAARRGCARKLTCTHEIVYIIYIYNMICVYIHVRVPKGSGGGGGGVQTRYDRSRVSRWSAINHGPWSERGSSRARRCILYVYMCALHYCCLQCVCVCIHIGRHHNIYARTHTHTHTPPVNNIIYIFTEWGVSTVYIYIYARVYYIQSKSYPAGRYTPPRRHKQFLI